jgi:glycosyltransferase involved in cell wall biosynthesis
VRFSIVIPTYDRPEILARCLGALRELEPVGGGFEVVVVNDGGAPPLESAVASLRSCVHVARVDVVSQPNAGPGAARNLGAARAHGELLAFTDDDCTPDPSWLVALDRALCVHPHALVGGRTINALGDNPYSSASHLVVEFVQSYFSGGARGRFFASNNFAVRRTDFLAAGGFHERFFRSTGEDREFSDRWAAQGRPSITANEAIVRHAHHLTFGGFVRQHFSYGAGAVAFRGVRAARGVPVRIDPAFYARSLQYSFAHGEGARAPILALLTVGAHLSYAGGLLWASIRGTPSTPTPHLPR